ncbi:MAG: amidinotransferase [Flavobacteriales bacterium]|nr:amidinotransferase [Flavobacteriales bacterium]
MSTTAEQRIAERVILIRPTGFGFDPETADTNPFQVRISDRDLRAAAEAEFDGLLGALDRCGVGVTVLDPADQGAPNGVFPNNWFSTHADGTVMVYPMRTPSRRRERDREIDLVLEEHGFRVRRLVDLSSLELDDRYLEGTGSLVLDRQRHMAYACLSPRTSERGLIYWCVAMQGYPVPFTATMDGTLTGQPVYHTNVLMSVGERFAAVCLDAMPYPVDRDDVQAELERGGVEVVPISLDQMHAYVGNMLQLIGRDGARYIFLSGTAFNVLKPEQRSMLERHGQLVPVEVPTIEAVGGGSVRCMLAENFLPLRPRPA